MPTRRHPHLLVFCISFSLLTGVQLLRVCLPHTPTTSGNGPTRFRIDGAYAALGVELGIPLFPQYVAAFKIPGGARSGLGGASRVMIPGLPSESRTGSHMAARQRGTAPSPPPPPPLLYLTPDALVEGKSTLDTIARGFREVAEVEARRARAAARLAGAGVARGGRQQKMGRLDVGTELE